MIAAAAVNVGGTVASTLATQIIIRIMNGNFNPNYKKEDRRRMKYIQKKYALSYQSGISGEEADVVIANIGQHFFF